MAVIHDTTTRYIDTNEAAAWLRVNPRTVRRLIHRREVPAVRIGGVYRIDADALDAQIRADTTGARY